MVMKTKYILLAASLILAAACEKPAIDISQDAVSLELSDIEKHLPYAGGEFDVSVATNCDDWDFRPGQDWIEVSASGNTLAVSVGENGEPAFRKGYVYVTVYNEDVALSDSLLIIQEGLSSLDLSAGETANCYIVGTGSDCYFDATVKGNGNASAQGSVSNYIEKYGVGISGAVKAELLWEATLDGNPSDGRRIIDGYPVFCDGRIFFKTGVSEGNAVIALKDVHGDILWSWHIWVTDAAIEDVEAGTGVVFMDRNLGAATVEPGVIGSRGMEYQWGRKDPLLPSLMSYEDCAVLGDYDYETNNFNVGDGTGKWDYALPMEHADKALGNACMAVLNPMSFIMTNFYVEPVKPYDWFCINPDAGAFLWGDDVSMDKTIFDPCPAGYTVPSASAWTAGDTFEPGDFGITVSGIFWPFTGYRITYSGNHDGTDEYGYYWTRSMCSEEGSEGRSLYMRADASGMELPFEGRAMPMAVRCVKM